MRRAPGNGGRQFQALEAAVGPSSAVENARALRFAALIVGLRSRLDSLRRCRVGKGGPYHSPRAESAVADCDKRAAQAGHGLKAMLFSGYREMAGDAAEDAVAGVFGTSDQFDQCLSPSPPRTRVPPATPRTPREAPSLHAARPLRARARRSDTRCRLRPRPPGRQNRSAGGRRQCAMPSGPSVRLCAVRSTRPSAVKSAIRSRPATAITRAPAAPAPRSKLAITPSSVDGS